MSRLVLVAVAALALVGGMTTPASGQQAGPAPTLVVTPATDLVDGQHVSVRGDGWQRARLYFEECEVGTTRCWYREQHADTGTDGILSADVEVRAYFVSETEGIVDCRATACELRANPYDSAVAEAPAVLLGFDVAAPLLPQPTITLTPDHDLVDGDVVVLEGTNFTPGEWLEYDECEAGALSYFDECHPLDNGSSLSHGWNGWPGDAPAHEQMRLVGPDGRFHERLRVYAQNYEYEQRTDCRVAACELVVAVIGGLGAAAARVPLAFDTDAPLRGPARVTVSPSAGLVHHQVVTVRGTGFYGREPVLVRQCVAGRDDCYSWNFRRTETDGGGSFAVAFRVNRRVRLASGRRADCRVVRCVVRVDRYYFAPRPHHVEVTIGMAP